MYTFSGVFFILFIWYFLKTECFTGRNLTLPAELCFTSPRAGNTPGVFARKSFFIKYL